MSITEGFGPTKPSAKVANGDYATNKTGESAKKSIANGLKRETFLLGNPDPFSCSSYAMTLSGLNQPHAHQSAPSSDNSGSTGGGATEPLKHTGPRTSEEKQTDVQPHQKSKRKNPIVSVRKSLIKGLVWLKRFSNAMKAASVEAEVPNESRERKARRRKRKTKHNGILTSQPA
jgi:hypothetical protein